MLKIKKTTVIPILLKIDSDTFLYGITEFRIYRIYRNHTY